MNKNYLIIGLIILALIVIGVIAARPAEDTDTTDENGTTQDENGNTDEEVTAGLSVEDQTTAGMGETVTIAEATIAEDGFVVIHRTNEDGTLIVDEVVGVQPIMAGENQDVEVELTEEVADGEVLIAMLHNDSGVTGEYEFSTTTQDVDTPVVVDDAPVTESFTVSLETSEEAPAEEGATDADASADANVEVDAAAE